ncbi:MAG: AAA family ATPase [Nocardioides sp.]|nr:AAA family ATPase [Nocardioides sp.]
MALCAACGGALPNLARFCPLCAAPVDAAPPAEERKLATVVFADLVGSTQLGEQDPERTRALLERFYDAMSAEIVETGGTVEKFAGDAVMAVFGAPVAQEDHAERALHASLSMLRRLAELFEGQLQLRIGVNTGEVVVGRPREGSSFVTGDAVNVAARLEQAAAPGEIVVGRRTVASVRGAFEFDEPQRVEAKGKPAGVECCRLLRSVSLTRVRGVGALRDVFVGRESELGLLQATYERVRQERRPHLVTVSADPGVGKSRLVRELWSWLEGQQPEPVLRAGRNLAYGQGITYWALGEILKAHLGLLETDTEDVVRRSLGAHEMLGLTLGLETSADLHPLAVRERLQEAWVEFLTDLTSQRPAVVLVEDMHWAEEPLLALLERLLRDVPGPLLLITTTRPELLDTHPTWGRGRNAATVWLEPLSGQVTEKLCHRLLGITLPAALRDVVLEKAEGNPFYVEELLATLMDRGLLVRDGETWLAHDIGDFVPPDSIQSILAARIDLLPTTEKLALQVAAVMGRVFWDGPVRELLGGVEPDLGLLEERDFVRRLLKSSMSGQLEYSIKHALTREVAYAMLPKSRRAHLHAAFAIWLEQGAGDREELAGLIAHHFAEAVRPEDADLAWAQRAAEQQALQASAVSWLRRAAEVAVARYLVDDGLGMLHRAVALEPDLPARAEIWRRIGLANAVKYDGEAFWTAMLRAIELAPAEQHAEIYADLALHTTMQAGMWRAAPDPALVRGWIDLVFELTEESHLLAKAYIARAGWSDRIEDRIEASTAGMTLAEDVGDPVLLAMAYFVDAEIALVLLDLGTMARRVAQAEALRPRINDPDVIATIVVTTQLYDTARGAIGAAVARAEESRELTEPLTPHHRVHGTAWLVIAHVLAGHWTEISELTPEVERRVAANLETPCVLNVRSLLSCALAATLLGDDGERARLEAVAESLGMTGFVPISVLRLRIALARGDLDRAAELAGRIDHDSARNSVSLVWADYLDALSLLGEAAAVEAIAPAMLLPGTYFEPFALRALGRVRADHALLDRAASLFEEMGLEWYAAETRASR